MLSRRTLDTLKERELYFNEIKYSLLKLGLFTSDSNRPIKI